MDSKYVVTCEDGMPIERLFARGEDGHLLFGVAGESVGPASTSDLLAGEVRFCAHVLEGFVWYFLSAQQLADALALTIRREEGGRNEHLEWFVQKLIQSQGCDVRRNAV